MAARTTQVVGEVMYGGAVTSPARTTQVVGEVMFKPIPTIYVWAEQVLVASSTRTSDATLNNPIMM